MNHAVSGAVYRGLADWLACGIDTQNIEAVAGALAAAQATYEQGQITQSQHTQLILEAEGAGYDL